MTEQSDQAPAPKTLFTASIVAFVIAVIILFTVILPAELEFDPLGVGGLLGINGLSAGDAPPLEEKLVVHRSDYVEFYLEPFQSVEYKYTMDFDSPLVFSWTADAELYFDMHAEPAGLGADGAESFEQGNATTKMGSYHAPFTGIHGWFWENRGSRDVEIRLYTAGFYENSKVFTANDEYDRDTQPVFDTE